MSLEENNEKIQELAIEALKNMKEMFGPGHTFPTDAIWEHIPGGVQIKSTKKPHQPRRLVKEGYLEETGAKTRAQSGPRAGSPTTEYRFGRKLVAARRDVASNAEHSSRSVVREGGASDLPELINHLRDSMELEGYVISAAEISNFMLAMAASPIVILSGISGTGKSLLPRKFAKLTESKFHQIPVQPQWNDNSDLFGYVPSLSPGRFVKGRLTDPLIDASRSHVLHLVLLDEMNLAPVEHYLSDYLSIVESRGRGESGDVCTDVLPFDLPSVPDPEVEELCRDLQDLRLPHNLRIVGTANMDETTHMFSPKVLDRAFTIEFDDPDLTAFAVTGVAPPRTFTELSELVVKPENAITVAEASVESMAMFEVVALWLEEIQSILGPAGVKFGYRTRDAILLYLHFWKKFNLSPVLAGCAALDFCILQKILPKVVGSGDALEGVLRQLVDWLDGWSSRTEASGYRTATEFHGSLERSRMKAARMLALLESDGATRFWGV